MESSRGREFMSILKVKKSIHIGIMVRNKKT